MTRVDYTSYATDYVALSTEEKPVENMVDGSTLLEVDTSTIYVFYQGTWYAQN